MAFLFKSKSEHLNHMTFRFMLLHSRYEEVCFDNISTKQNSSGMDKVLTRIVVIFEHFSEHLSLLKMNESANEREEVELGDNDQNNNKTAHHLIYHSTRYMPFICISVFN